MRTTYWYAPGELGYGFFFKEQDEEVGWSWDTGGPKRCGTCGVMSAQSAGRAVRWWRKVQVKEGRKIPSANNVSQHNGVTGDFWRDEWRGRTHLEERQYLLFALMLPKELRGSVVVADDDVPVRLVVKSVWWDRRATNSGLSMFGVWMINERQEIDTSSKKKWDINWGTQNRGLQWKWPYDSRFMMYKEDTCHMVCKTSRSGILEIHLQVYEFL